MMQTYHLLLLFLALSKEPKDTDNLQGSHNSRVHLQHIRKDILTLTYGKDKHSSLTWECDGLSKQIQ